jgi:hypothetical protein
MKKENAAPQQWVLFVVWCHSHNKDNVYALAVSTGCCGVRKMK